MKGLPNCLVWHNKPPQEEVPSTSRFVSTWAQICTNSVEILFNAPLCAYPSRPSCPPRPILFLLISAIILSIATIIDTGFNVFDLKSRDFGGFNAGFNVFNVEIDNEFNLENSGLINNEYGSLWPQTQTPHSTAPPNDTVFYFNPTGAGLREFNVYGEWTYSHNQKIQTSHTTCI